MALKMPEEADGWSVNFKAVAEDESPWFLMARGLWREEAIALGRMLFNRDKRGHVEVCDHRGVSQVYWSPRRPNGFGLDPND